MDLGLISKHQTVGLYIQKAFHLTTEHKGRSGGMFHFLIMYLSVGLVDVWANNLSSDMCNKESCYCSPMSCAASQEIASHF